MALVLSLTKTITDYSVLTLVDNTGDYNVDTNPNGWGAPNLELSDIDYAKLTVTTPEGTTLPTIDIILDLGIDFSTINSDELIYNLTNDMLGGTLGSTIVDGIWTILYEVSDDSGVTTTSLTIRLGTYYRVQAEVFKNIAKIPEFYSCKRCCTLQLKDVVTQFMLLQALIYASDYTYLTEYENILTTLQQVVSFNLDLICNC